MPSPRFVRRVMSLLAAIVVISCFSQPASALNGHWQPPGVMPSQTPLATVLRQVETARGAVHATYVEQLRIVTAGRTLLATAHVAGGNVRYTSSIDGATYTMGRFAGTRWRRTPAGLVRTLQSDLQGDPLDRWPVSTFPLSSADCALVGETRGQHPEWVVQVAPARDAVHWLYIDESSGAIDSEITRDGSAVFSTVFDDRREAIGALRPFHWRISGFGGPADIWVDAIEPEPADPANVAIPVSLAADVLPDTNLALGLPAVFRSNRIMIDVEVNGRRRHFLLDTGTTQMLMTEETARACGISTVLAHGVARSFTVGALALHDVPIMTVPSIFGLDGILGYDFFAGSIVHIDYHGMHLDIEPRAHFVPPDGASELPTRFDEGLPLASAHIGALDGDRFALDTGSAQLLLPRYLWESRGIDESAVGVRQLGGGIRPQTQMFLEGPIVTLPESVPDVRFGGLRFIDVVGFVERTNAGPAIEIPFDAILGTDVLSQFEWWFDYSGGHAWIKAAG